MLKSLLNDLSLLLPQLMKLFMCPATGITPTIRVESPSDSLAEGKTVVLNCVVEGQTHQEVTWYRQGQPLSANHQVCPVFKRPPMVLVSPIQHYILPGSACAECSCCAEVRFPSSDCQRLSSGLWRIHLPGQRGLRDPGCLNHGHH